MQYRSTPVAIAAVAVLVTALMAQTQPAADAPIPLCIAKDTTYILSPLRPDGTPDYLEAYNARLPKISADKNAFTYLFQATGPMQDPKVQKQMLDYLHLAPFPPTAKFLQPLYKFEKLKHPIPPGTPYDYKSDKAAQLRESIEKELLSADDQAIISDWLDTQAEPMKLLEQAAEQNTFVIPLCAKNEEHSLGDALPFVSSLLECVAPFCARANLRAARADFAGSQKDLTTALRLARLIQQTPLQIVRLMGAAGESNVCKTTRAIALNAPMSAAQIDSLAKALMQVPLAPTLADTYTIGERFFALDIYTQFARGKGAHYLRLYLMLFSESTPVDEGDLNQVDWNVLLRSANHSFDESAEIFASTDWRAIRKSLEKEAATRPVEKDIPIFPAYSIFTPGTIETDFTKEWEKQRTAVLQFLHKLPTESRKQFTDRIHKLFSTSNVVDTHFTNLFIYRALEFPLTQTTLAIAAYRAQNRIYPPTLAALVPQFLPALPQDPYSDNPLIYRTTPAGFLLYSIGPNEKDDNGIKDSKKSQDDIAVTFPAPPPAPTTLPR